MNARSLIALPALAASVLAAAPETASDLAFTRPAGWGRSVDVRSHLVILTPPARHASAAFMDGQDFGGTADAWHRGIWDRLTRNLKPRGAVTDGRRGDFQTTWAAFDKPDGAQTWVCLYTVVRDGRGEGVLFFADGEGPFRSNLTTVNQMVDGITFAPPTAVGASNPPAAPAEKSPPAAPATNTAANPPRQTMEDLSVTPPSYTVLPPSTPVQPPPPAAPVEDLTIACPPGWAVQQDPRTRAICMQPPDSPSVN